jgi:glutamyl-tRNA synthetase
MSVRVRFAPSPTGYLHVGGLRTALYNYLFARNKGGKMIIRIEDTDRTRFVDNAQENLLNALQWAGITFDEGPGFGGEYGPYIQSERFDLYTKYSQELIDSGSAYYAFDTAEEIEAMRERQKKAGIAPKYDRSTMKNQFTLGEQETKRYIDEGLEKVVRLKVPFNEEIKFKDIIRGDVSVKTKDVDDQILMKSDGFPTYHLANVVDDHLMEISHVIRGEEWLPSTPKHVLLYKSFGWEMPEFAHLPLLLNNNKTKLSKRHGDVAVEDFKQNGYIKEALVNFVALLGWNPSGDNEIHSMDHLIEHFNLEKVNKGGAIFDRPKLLWMNSMYLRKQSSEEIYDMLIEDLKSAGIDMPKGYVLEVITLLKERISFAKDLVEFADYMWGKPSSFDVKFKEKQWKEGTEELVLPAIDIFKAAEIWEVEPLHKLIEDYLNEKGVGFGKLMNPIRLMITGKSVGAGMFETMVILGKEECLERFEEFLTKLRNGEI